LEDRGVRTLLSVIEEKGVRLTVEVLESVGFGDSINNDARYGSCGPPQVWVEPAGSRSCSD